MNEKFKTYKARAAEEAIGNAVAAKAGYIAGALTIVGVTVAIIAWEYGKYTGSHFGSIALAAVLSGCISAVCFFISIAAITDFFEQFFFCSPKFRTEDARSIRLYATARLIICGVIVFALLGKTIPWLHSLLVSPSDLAFLHGIGIL